MIPATVEWKLPKITAFLILVTAVSGIEIPAAFSETAGNKAIKAGLLANGTYLYGETPQPNQIMKGYVVFQNQQGRVVGALYYPRSDFECFTGSTQKGALNVESLNFEKTKT